MELFEELNYPSATKLRAALLKKGYKARLKDVEDFVKSQTPTQLFAKAPKYRGKIVASRPNDRWVMDFIDFSAEPSGEFKYIFLAQDIFSRKLWATAFTDQVHEHRRRRSQSTLRGLRQAERAQCRRRV